MLTAWAHRRARRPVYPSPPPWTSFPFPVIVSVFNFTISFLIVYGVFCFCFIYLNRRIVTASCWFFSRISVNWPRAHVCPPILNLPPASPTPSCRVVPEHWLGCPLHAPSSHWPSILRVAVCLFQCHPLQSSHPRLLPSPQSALRVRVVSAALRAGLALPSFSVHT